RIDELTKGKNDKGKGDKGKKDELSVGKGNARFKQWVEITMKKPGGGAGGGVAAAAAWQRLVVTAVVVWRRVVASDLMDRVDRSKRSIFGFAGKSPPEKFSGGRRWRRW
nr:hypothetical protein [Tanacetum cinerariifolium]